MARYIDVEGYRKLFDEEYKKTRELIFQGETYLDNIAEGFSEASKVIDRIPTADVVPKSEVEEIIGKFECLLCHVTEGRLSKYTYDLRTMETVATDCINETYNDGYAEGGQEVAREIFEEIENFIPRFRVGYFSYASLTEGIAELKKKYIKEDK